MGERSRSCVKLGETLGAGLSERLHERLGEKFGEMLSDIQHTSLEPGLSLFIVYRDICDGFVPRLGLLLQHQARGRWRIF